MTIRHWWREEKFIFDIEINYHRKKRLLFSTVFAGSEFLSIVSVSISGLDENQNQFPRVKESRVPFTEYIPLNKQNTQINSCMLSVKLRFWIRALLCIQIHLRPIERMLSWSLKKWLKVLKPAIGAILLRCHKVPQIRTTLPTNSVSPWIWLFHLLGLKNEDLHIRWA